MLRRKAQTKTVTFGARGVTGVKYLGDLPFEWTGTHTCKIYVWRKAAWPLWVDKRDLPGLVKAAGRDKLESTGLPLPTPKKAKPKPEPEPENEQPNEVSE